ncbi:MAG: GNAT family N-acetyltransferase [Gemmatimonadales bacterium]|nr:GNAT family N-acetyltransferase [Gemmatimonadales bacterium]MDQ3427269.1 GNAT family N-acetyltransferase [Gemmatimonadota bacterium]
MKWRPDRSVRGPDRPTLRDIDPLNRVFAESFTDRYSRDGLVGVRVPQLNPLVWRYALEDAGDGAMIWRDADGQMVSFNMVHRSGTEGWMGPLAVRPDRQGEGIGSMMVRIGVDWLRSQGATTIGLETMPRTVDNIGFYSRIGLVPGHLTVTLVHEAPHRAAASVERLSAAGTEAGERIEECRRLTDDLLPGVDFTREIALTRELAIGDTTLVREGEDLVGFALWHSTPLAAGRPRDELRVLKLVARSMSALDRLLEALQASAGAERVGRVALRCQTGFSAAYLRLVTLGYRVHWTDLRMILGSHPQPAPREGIVMSNWEI